MSTDQLESQIVEAPAVVPPETYLNFARGLFRGC